MILMDVIILKKKLLFSHLSLASPITITITITISISLSMEISKDLDNNRDFHAFAKLSDVNLNLTFRM